MAIQAPTPVVTQTIASITAPNMQADKLVIEAIDATGVFAASVVLSFFDNSTPAIFARDVNGKKITSSLSIPDVVARITKRAGQGNTKLRAAFTSIESAIQDEYALVQQEQAAITSAQSALTVAQTALAASPSDPALQAAVGAAQTALSNAIAAAV